MLSQWGLDKNICPSRHVSGFTVATCSTDAISAEKMCLLMMNQVVIAAGTGLDSKLHLHVCLHTAQTVCVYKLCSCRHTLAPLLCLPQTRAPSPFLLYLLTTATTNMQSGRRLTHLDYPPPPTHFPATSLLTLWCLNHHSSPGHSTHWLSHFLSLSPLHIHTNIFFLSFRLSSDRWLFAVVFMC